MNLTEKLIAAHLVSGEMIAGEQIAIRIDQTLTQDSTGTMAYLQFEALGIPRVRTKRSVAYIDHNMLQESFENADDHRYLRTVAANRARILADYEGFFRSGTGEGHRVFVLPGGQDRTRLASLASLLALQDVQVGVTTRPLPNVPSKGATLPAGSLVVDTAQAHGRFAEVEEDEAPLRLLVSDYRKFLA